MVESLEIARRAFEEADQLLALHLHRCLLVAEVLKYLSEAGLKPVLSAATTQRVQAFVQRHQVITSRCKWVWMKAPVT